jgi:hypothetical protein
VIADKGYAGEEFESAVEHMGARLLRPARKDEPDDGRHLEHPLAHREHLLDLQDLPTLKRHGARTLTNLRARIAARLRAVAACRPAQPHPRPSQPQPHHLHRLNQQQE